MVGTPLVRERLPAVEPEPCREVGFQPLALAAHLGRRVVVLLDPGELAAGLDVPLPLGVGQDGAFYAVCGCGHLQSPIFARMLSRTCSAIARMRFGGTLLPMRAHWS